ncbi:MAG: DUF2231 domain-containing protein [Bacteroidota bacterium]
MLLLDSFIGRFHPLVVHLPIGFLILGVLMEFFFKKSESTDKVIAFTWLMGGLGAAASAFIGWLLANEGGYNEDTLFWHRWIGIGLTAVAFAGWWVKSGRLELGKTGNWALNVGVIVALSVVGHLGGNMTHGSDYLIENAPKPIKAMLGEEEAEEVNKTITKTPDSIGVYADLLAPVFEEKCIRCHDDEIQRGGLNMAHPEGFHEGGDHGEVIAGSAAESELFRRVTLLPDHSKYMPLKGTPMTFKEIKLMEWWLESGASFEASLKDQEVPKDIKFVLLEEYGVDLSEKSYYEKVKVAAATESAIQAMEEAGFKVEALAAGNGLLEVSYSGSETPNLELLTQAKEQITWLDLGNVDLSGVTFSPIGQLKNLTRLQLENTVTTDENIADLTGLKHLESLNLHHSKVTDACLESIEKMTGLKRVYLWETAVNEAAVEDLRSKREDLEVDMGFSFAPIAKSES